MKKTFILGRKHTNVTFIYIFFLHISGNIVSKNILFKNEWVFDRHIFEPTHKKTNDFAICLAQGLYFWEKP